MALPSVPQQSTLAGGAVAPQFWLEIEGLPDAFGTAAQVAGFFAARAAQYQKTSIKGLLPGPPRGADATVRPLEAEASIGQITAEILDDESGSMLPLIANVARLDRQVLMNVGLLWRSFSPTVGYIVRPTPLATSRGDPGANHWFRCTTAGAGGGTEPVWPAAGTVADGAAVWTEMGPLDLPADLTAYNVPYTGTAADADYPPGGGIIYIGREAMSYSAKTVAPGAQPGGYFTLTGRSWYSIGLYQDRYSHTAGDVITPYPRFLATRRANLYCTLDGTDASRFCRFSGVIADYSAGNGLVSAVLTINSIEAELKSQRFSQQRFARLRKGVKDGAGVYEKSDSSEQDPVDNLLYIELDSSVDVDSWISSGVWVYCRIGREYFLGQILTDSTQQYVLNYSASGRGIYGSPQEQHHPGDELKEVIPVLKKDTTGGGAVSQTQFSAGDNPIEVMLQLLCSTGRGTNGAYDTLTADLGLAIDQSRIDIAGALVLLASWLPVERELRIIDAPFVTKAMLAEICKEHLCYPVWQIGAPEGKYVFKRLNPPMPNSSTRAITADDVLEAPTFAADVGGVIGRVLYRTDFDPVSGDFQAVFRQEIIGPNAEAQEFYAGIFQTLEVFCKGQYTGKTLASGFSFGNALGTNVQQAALRFCDTIRDRFSKPGTALKLVLAYNWIDIEVGDLVTLTLGNIPNITTGARGFSGVVCEIREKSIDDVEGTVTVTLSQTYFAAQYRLQAPCGTVNAWNAGTRVATLNAHDFTDPAGTAHDADSFVVGDVLRFHDPTFKTDRGAATVTAHTPGTDTITLSAAPAGVAANDILHCDDYDASTAARKALSAFLANSSNAPKALGAAADAAHQYGG